MTELNAEVKALLERHSKAIEDKFGELGVRELNARLCEIEQKMERRGGPSEYEIATKSIGQQFVEGASRQLKELAEDTSRPFRFRMDLKTTITTGATSGGPTGGQAYRDDVVMTPQRKLRVRDLIPVVGITTGSYEYAKQTTRTNNAATVAEAAAKPESAYGWTMQSGKPEVIAHWIPASRQILDDAPQLMGLIDTELRYGLALKEDSQLLSGDGVSPNLTGLIPAATAYAAPFDPAGTETMIDQIGLAFLQATLADYEPTGIIMHPSDWMRIMLLKDTSGFPIIGDPVNGGVVSASGPSGPMLFGRPVVTTTSMAVDKFLVGDFQRAGTLYDRWAPRVEISTEHSDFFTKNLVAILCEERLGLGIKQGGALIYGDFGNVA